MRQVVNPYRQIVLDDVAQLVVKQNNPPGALLDFMPRDGLPGGLEHQTTWT